MTEHTVMPKTLILWVITQCLVIVFDGIPILLLLDATETTQLIHAHHKRIPLDCLRAIVLRSGKVVKIIFCHSPIEPWLIEIRLGRDSLVEILYGKDVILEIECRSPYHHQPVGFELGITN
jgi:hypothetical protein